MSELPRPWRVRAWNSPAFLRQRDLALCGVAVLAMVVFVGLHLVASDVPWIRRLELLALDVRFRLRGPEMPGREIALVLIDDATIAELGRWPLPRRKFAEAIDFLHDSGAKVIGIDVIFAEPEASTTAESGDLLMAQAMRRAGNVVLPFAFRFEREVDYSVPPQLAPAAFLKVRKSSSFEPVTLHPAGVLAPLPPLAQAAAALGHATIAYDVDGAPRYDYPIIEYDVDYYPSMALRLVQLFRDVSWSDVTADLGRDVEIGDIALATDPAMRMVVNYLGPRGSFPTFPFAQVAAGTLPASLFRDRIVLIGPSITGIPDSFRTPFSTVLPGVERLATVVDSILHDRQLRRPIYAPWLEAAWMIFFALTTALAISRGSALRASLIALLLLGAVWVAGQFAWQSHGIWYAAAVPLVASIFTFTLLIAFRYGLLDREHRRVRQAFQRYLAPHMVERLSQSRRPPELGGELRELTVLFCDLRGFSGIAERLDAPELTRVINEFFTTVTTAVLEHGGTVDKYMGDAVMAFWNAPVEQPDHARLACRAALDILVGLDRLNARGTPDTVPLSCGVGINTGMCTVGNFGSRYRFDYSALGDPVNIAARLEGETKSFGVRIAVGGETAMRAAELAALPLDRIRVRGRDQSVELWALIGDENRAQNPFFIALRRKHLAFRQALSAENWRAARGLLDELRSEAPADLVSLYDSLLQRLPS